MNILSQFIKSLYSPKTISTFRFQGIGKTILYIFVLMLIVSLPLGIKITQSVINGSEKFNHALTHDIPDFKLDNGVLYSEKNDPYIHTEDDMIFVIDPTGELTYEDLMQYEIALALFEKEAVFIEYGNIENIRYRDFGNISLTKTELSNIVETINSLLPIFIPIFLFILYLVSTAMKFIGITFLSVIGLLLKRIVVVNLNYKQLWVLSAYTVTLPTTLIAIIDFLNISIFSALSSFTTYWIIAVIMLYYVVSKIPKRKTQQNNFNSDTSK